MNETQLRSEGIHYVCIATAQNSVNILPLFTDTRYQLKNICHLTILSSNHGKIKIWTDQLMSFFEDEKLLGKKIIVDILIMDNLNHAGKLLAENIKDDQEIVVNVGGGVKTIALSIWTYAIQNNWERGWEIIYPNMEEKCIEVYTGDGHKSLPLQAKVELQHILKLYGHSIRNEALRHQNETRVNHFSDARFRMAFYHKLNEKNKTLFQVEDQNGELLPMEDAINSMVSNITPITNQIRDNLYSEILKELDNYHQQMKSSCDTFKDLIQKNIQVKYPEFNLQFPPFNPARPNLQPIVPTAFSIKTIKTILTKKYKHHQSTQTEFDKFEINLSAPIYFEKVVQNDVLTYIKSINPRAILEAFLNVEITAREKNYNDAEHDILLNLFNGQLISLDAKTVGSEPKDLFSRIKRLENLAGIYTRFVVIFPYIWQDFTEDNLNNIAYLKNLQLLPFFFDTHQISFCVYSPFIETYYITQTSSGIVKAPEPTALPNQKSVKIQHFTHFLDQLLSIKMEKNSLSKI